jgi:NitT/TauT family transport system permease protein
MAAETGLPQQGLAGQPVLPATGNDGARRKGRGKERLLVWGLPTLVLAIIIGAWEFVAQTGIVNEIIVPPATEVFKSLVELSGERYFWEATQVTMTETLVGFAAGSIAAWILGTLIGMFAVARYAFYPPAVAFQIAPRVALAPLFLTWFGFGITSKIVMAATICFFPVLLAVVVGLQTVDHDSRTLMRSLGASRWEEYVKLSLPSSLPIIFSGLKNAITLALIGAIVAEFIGASEGMGVLIKTFNFQLEVADGFAVIIALMLFGLVLYGIMELLDNKIVFWRSRS